MFRDLERAQTVFAGIAVFDGFGRRFAGSRSSSYPCATRRATSTTWEIGLV
jgi:hypothetical protein